MKNTGLIACMIILFNACIQPKNPKQQTVHVDSTLYKTETLIVKQLTEHVYQHITFLSTQSFGKVDCNGMIVVDNNEAIVFDTPADSISTVELLGWLDKSGFKVKAIIPTHFHLDCVGGLNEFHANGIPSYAHSLTINFLKQQAGAIVPQNTFEDSVTLTAGNLQVQAYFLGAGHTRDNIIGYVPAENVMFGGCLVKSVGAGKGNLADADTTVWSETMISVQQKFPNSTIVIPGHGETGNSELLKYTQKLFTAQKHGQSQ
ncbi:MAG TPA: subclass B1 metallo-beta-lactamase [Cyclobacteriaceae bacterium]|jgi:metallo-beta-lactamase class B|nr:subclass B1 metallo-beta-lactamase [Cytophagales bacterium]HMR58249.1 subclass B1 metallo-beta-lactamase [Cyclobacteriaceae bacterium]HRF34461.1 subclass B1 metallo-beta-lactamase [Cyclobacteriaceae bacterium]